MNKLYERENILLGRKRYAFEIDHPGKGTPKKEELKEEFAQKLKVPSDQLNIKHIYTNFGKNTSKVIINVYEDRDVMKLLETPKGKKEEKK